MAKLLDTVPLSDTVCPSLDVKTALIVFPLAPETWMVKVTDFDCTKVKAMLVGTGS